MDGELLMSVVSALTYSIYIFGLCYRLRTGGISPWSLRWGVGLVSPFRGSGGRFGIFIQYAP